MSLLVLINSIQQVKAEIQNSAEPKAEELIFTLSNISCFALRVSKNGEAIAGLLTDSIQEIESTQPSKADILAPIKKSLQIIKTEFHRSSVRGLK
jgi:hypothetical protein